MCSLEVATYYPEHMTSLPNWVLWKLEDVNGRTTKIPYSPLYHGKASSTSPDTWSTFDRVMEIFSNSPTEYTGIGFVFTLETNIVFIDIDHCIDSEGYLDDRAKVFLQEFNGKTYCELSQSGTGLHIFVQGTIPKSFKNSSLNIEMYNSGRFCAMTGSSISQCDVMPLQAELDEMYEKYKRKRTVKPNIAHDRDDISLTLSDNEVIEKASSNAVSGEQFSRLYSGDTSDYSSHSECDLRLCQLLAFWCDGNPNQIDRIFRTSGLVRVKWLRREDYRRNTIQSAIDYCTEYYSQYVTRKKEEESLRRDQIKQHFLHEQRHSRCS